MREITATRIGQDTKVSCLPTRPRMTILNCAPIVAFALGFGFIRRCICRPTVITLVDPHVPA